MKGQPASLLETRNISDFVEEIDKLIAEIQELYLQDAIPWIIGVSWGKDSTTVLQLVWSAIETLVSVRNSESYISVSDRSRKSLYSKSLRDYKQ